MRTNGKIKNAKNLIQYYNALSKKDKNAWNHIFINNPVEKVETLKDYIARTGCRTETRKSKKGIEVIKVYFEDGKIKEYEKSRIDTITSF